jgi:hypothetical protein
MAELNAIKKLDLKLLENKIIDPEYRLDYKLVHSMLNTHVRKNGKILTEETFKKGDEKLRAWLMNLYKKGASQEKLTSYLRCGLAHLCYDFIESTYKRIPEDDLLSRALSSFKLRKFNTSFFRVAKSELKAKKKKPVKKTVKKAVKKKPVIKKKPIVKLKTNKKVKKPGKKTIKKITRKIIKKAKPGTKAKKTKSPVKKIVRIRLTTKSVLKKSSIKSSRKSSKKPKSISSKLQSFLKNKKIIKKRPSSYWKDK